MDRKAFLPTTKQDLVDRGMDACDFVFVTGDAYVDHPTFAMALLGRLLQDAGYSVAILSQPKWNSIDDFMRFGSPKLAFLVSSGNMESMVNHYTAAKKIRSSDAFSPGGKAGLRPDRATTVYSQCCKKAYPDVPVIIGGIEASLRRFAHYDYWDHSVHRSILVDSSADMLLFGMAEESLLGVGKLLQKGVPISSIRKLAGSCVYIDKEDVPKDAIWLPSFESCKKEKTAFAKAFATSASQQDSVCGKPLAQPHGGRAILQNVPAPMIGQALFDHLYELPFTRQAHPDYDAVGGVPALSEVQFSITANRGCYGNCSFCALSFHQGRHIVRRSDASLIREAEMLAKHPDFKGYIHDVGGPTANFCMEACDKMKQKGFCADKNCCGNERCKKLRISHQPLMHLLRQMRQIPGVKKVFLRSGLRYDYLLYDTDGTFFNELITHHVSGQLKVAPEHVNEGVLRLMGKPSKVVYDRFIAKFEKANQSAGKEQYLVPYLMSGHPGSDMNAAIELAQYLRKHNIKPEQVQDFYPTPGTKSTCMYYTGLDPSTMQSVYVPKNPKEKSWQRALLQATKPQNYAVVRQALRACGREDLIGFGPSCIVPPESRPAHHTVSNMPNRGERRQNSGKSHRSRI